MWLRAVSLREPDVPASDLVSRLASKYRYSGRTQYQVQLASSVSASATLDRSANATLDRSTNASLASSRKYTGASKSLDNGLCNSPDWLIDLFIDLLIEFRFNVQLHTKYLIWEMLFPASLLAVIQKTKTHTILNNCIWTVLLCGIWRWCMFLWPLY